jgi:hypothetical protein
MKLIAAVIATLTLTGCASTCERACVFGMGPGNPVFNAIADRADRDDQCQTRTHSTLTGARLKADGHVPPDFCKYRGRPRLDIYDRYNHRIGSIR